MKWRYEDWERPRGKCYDCRTPYWSFMDMIVPDEVWEKINPTYHEGGGLLCPDCIHKRIQMTLGHMRFPVTCYVRYERSPLVPPEERAYRARQEAAALILGGEAQGDAWRTAIVRQLKQATSLYRSALSDAAACLAERGFEREDVLGEWNQMVKQGTTINRIGRRVLVCLKGWHYLIRLRDGVVWDRGPCQTGPHAVGKSGELKEESKR